MGWIKRNIIFVVCALLAVGLLGGAGYYIYLGWSHNVEQTQQLGELYDKLKQIASSTPQPGNDKIDNLKIARDQDQQLRAWLSSAAGAFRPVPPIPPGEVTSKTYASALGTTIYQLQQEAKENSVGYPTNYYFSFQVQSSKLTISSGLGPLAQQLGEVKAIAEVLFAARVNNLDGIQRVRVSDDDVNGGLQSDYIDKPAVTNDLAVITPYVVTFQCFTPELARTISGFATSTNPFVVKSVSVQPSNAAGAADTGFGTPPLLPPNQRGTDRYARMASRYARMPGMQPQPPPITPTPGKGGLQTALKEQLLRVTLEVDLVKLLPKS